jgi:mRNA interferase MazF
MPVIRGEVYWATLPPPVGPRPVLIVQNNAGNRSSPNTIVAHLSTSPPPVEYPFLAALDNRVLGEPSWAHCETLNTIPQALLQDKCGSLTPKEMDQVTEALKRSLALK